jgi:hypothetical protein
VSIERVVSSIISSTVVLPDIGMRMKKFTPT